MRKASVGLTLAVCFSDAGMIADSRPILLGLVSFGDESRLERVGTHAETPAWNHRAVIYEAVLDMDRCNIMPT